MQHLARFAVILITFAGLAPLASCDETRQDTARKDDTKKSDPSAKPAEGSHAMLAAAAQAATRPSTDPSAEEGFVSAFNGKDLAGWVVTTCKAGVENGNLVLLEGNGFVRLEKLYGDFVLEIDWKNRQAEKFDSGIYFRGEKLKLGRRYPDKYQVNLLQGEEGSIVTNKQVKVVGNGSVKGACKAGEWNHFRLTVIGTKAELEINGKPAWKVDGIAPAIGYVGLQCEVPNGGQFEFKNIRIKAITPAVDEEKD